MSFCKFSLISSALMVFCIHSTLIAQESDRPAKPVKMYKVGSGKNSGNIAYPAVVDAGSTANLSFAVPGTVVKLSVKESDAVKKGQLIAQMDQATFESQLKSAQSSYSTAKSDFDRAKKLIKENAISRKDFEKRKTEMTRAQDALESAKKALADSTLKAPFDGVVSKIKIEQNQTVQATQEIATVINNGSMIARANIPSSVVAKSKNQAQAKFFVSLEASPENLIPAQIDEANLEADAVTQTYEISFLFTPPTDLLVFPGMNAQVFLQGASEQGSMSNHVTVPLQSILSQGEKKYVWLVNTKTMRVRKTEVLVKNNIGKSILVTKGLSAGDIVVGAGASYLSDDMKVKAWSKSRKK